MNFLHDYADMARARLMSVGYAVDAAEPDEKALERLLNVLHRRVPVAPRRTYCAKDFTCPPEHEHGLTQLLKVSESGGDLRPYQSTRLDDANFDDGMLNDCDIQHFHLGVAPYAKNPIYKDRTGPVLYAMVKADALYCTKIMEHKNWSRSEMLDIIHDNWPDLLEGSAIKSGGGMKVVGLSVNYSDKEIEKLRRAGVNVLTQRSDGTIHVGPGGGAVATGQSVKVRRAVDQIVIELSELEATIRSQIEKGAEKGQVTGDFQFRLVEENGSVFAVDQARNARIQPRPSMSRPTSSR